MVPNKTAFEPLSLTFSQIHVVRPSAAESVSLWRQYNFTLGDQGEGGGGDVDSKGLSHLLMGLSLPMLAESFFLQHSVHPKS